MVAYLRVISAPLGISLLVMSVQWICKGALELGLAGCLISAGLLALAPSTALAMAVEFHHLLKVPGEVIEGLQRSDHLWILSEMPAYLKSANMKPSRSSTSPASK